MRIALLTTDSREHFNDYTCCHPYFGASPEALIQGFKLLNGSDLHGGVFRMDVISCSQERMSSPEYLASNVRFHSLYVPKIGWMRTGFAGCILRIRSLLASLRPNIVHGEGSERECAVGAVFSGFPNVVTIHGNMSELARMYGAKFPDYAWCASKLEDFSLQRTSGVFCNSAYTEALVAPRAQRTWRVPNPIRMEFFKSQELRSPNNVPILLNVGVISPRKRQVEILELARKLYLKGLRFQINFIGSHDGTSYGHRFIEMLSECAEFAIHRDHLPTAELIAQFDAADALIHFPEEEAFGLVVAEALARNLKFFGAQLGGIIDICEGVEAAVLVEKDDFNGLSHLIEAWTEAGFPRPTTASSEMAERYHPRVIAGKHLDIYRELLEIGVSANASSR